MFTYAIYTHVFALAYHKSKCPVFQITNPNDLPPDQSKALLRTLPHGNWYHWTVGSQQFSPSGCWSKKKNVWLSYKSNSVINIVKYLQYMYVYIYREFSLDIDIYIYVPAVCIKPQCWISILGLTGLKSLHVTLRPAEPALEIPMDPSKDWRFPWLAMGTNDFGHPLGWFVASKKGHGPMVTSTMVTLEDLSDYSASKTSKWDAELTPTKDVNQKLEKSVSFRRSIAQNFSWRFCNVATFHCPPAKHLRIFSVLLKTSQNIQRKN